VYLEVIPQNNDEPKRELVKGV